MSWQTTAWVAKESRSTGNTRLVFMMLANHMGPCGDNAYPSLETLAREAGGRDTPLSRNTVIAAIKRLEELGEILVYEAAGKGTGGRPTNRYELPHVEGWEPPHGIEARRDFRATLAPKSDDDFRAVEPDLSRDSEGLSRGLERARVSLLEQPKDLEQTPRVRVIESADYEFEEFWSSYPKRNGAKAGKVNARKQWVRLKPHERVEARAALDRYAAAKNGYPEDAERYLRHKRWVGLEIETADERGSRTVRRAFELAEQLGMQ